VYHRAKSSCRYSTMVASIHPDRVHPPPTVVVRELRRFTPRPRPPCARWARAPGLTNSADRSIRVNVLVAGSTGDNREADNYLGRHRPIPNSSIEEFRSARVSTIPLGRFGDPVEIANAAVFWPAEPVQLHDGIHHHRRRWVSTRSDVYLRKQIDDFR